MVIRSVFETTHADVRGCLSKRVCVSCDSQILWGFWHVAHRIKHVGYSWWWTKSQKLELCGIWWVVFNAACWFLGLVQVWFYLSHDCCGCYRVLPGPWLPLDMLSAYNNCYSAKRMEKEWVEDLRSLHKPQINGISHFCITNTVFSHSWPAENKQQLHSLYPNNWFLWIFRFHLTISTKSSETNIMKQSSCWILQSLDEISNIDLH